MRIIYIKRYYYCIYNKL